MANINRWRVKEREESRRLLTLINHVVFPERESWRYIEELVGGSGGGHGQEKLQTI